MRDRPDFAPDQSVGGGLVLNW